MARDYKKEVIYESSPEQVKNRVKRNKARRQMVEEGKAHKGDHKDVDHIKPLIKGGGVSLSNLRVVTEKANRSFPRTSKARMK